MRNSKRHPFLPMYARDEKSIGNSCFSIFYQEDLKNVIE